MTNKIIDTKHNTSYKYFKKIATKKGFRKEKNKSFHARHSAKERIYEYQIINRQGSLSLDKYKSWNIKKKIKRTFKKKSRKKNFPPPLIVFY